MWRWRRALPGHTARNTARTRRRGPRTVRLKRRTTNVFERSSARKSSDLPRLASADAALSHSASIAEASTLRSICVTRVRNRSRLLTGGADARIEPRVRNVAIAGPCTWARFQRHSRLRHRKYRARRPNRGPACRYPDRRTASSVDREPAHEMPSVCTLMMVTRVAAARCAARASRSPVRPGRLSESQFAHEFERSDFDVPARRRA